MDFKSRRCRQACEVWAFNSKSWNWVERMKHRRNQHRQEVTCQK